MSRVKVTPAHTDPASITLAAGDVQEVIIDTTLKLGEEQAPTSPSVTLLELPSRREVVGGATLDTVPVEDNNIFVRVTGIERAKTYELRTSFNHTSPRVVGEKTVLVTEIIGV